MNCKFLVIAAFITLFGCLYAQKSTAQKNDAEEYYNKALGILNRTTHNALSRTLANEALAYIDKAIAIDPSETKYFRVKGTSLFHLKEYEKAIASYNEALRLDSANSHAWMGRAIAFENMQRYAEAEQDYGKALELDQGSLPVHFNLGLLYEKWGKLGLSLLAYDHVIMMDPDNESAYLNRGELKLQMKKYAEALSDFNMSISLDSTNKLAYNNRGLAKFYLKQYEGAIADLQKSLSFRKDDSFYENFNTDQYAYNNIANAYFGMGNTKEACHYWNLALQKGYKYKKEWKEMYDIDDPTELVAKYCK